MPARSPRKALFKPRPTADPDSPPRQHDASMRALLLVGASWGLRAAVLLSLALCRPLVHRDIRMSSKVLQGLGAAAFMGSSGGAALSGLLADICGRKRALLVSMLVSLLGLYGASHARGHVHLIIGHALVGIGAGGEVPSATVLLQELAPRPSDGARSVALLGVFAALGGVAGTALSMKVAPAIGWRELYRVGSAAGIVLVLAKTAWLPESTRWSHTLCRVHSQRSTEVDAELPVVDQKHSSLLQLQGQIRSTDRNAQLVSTISTPHIKTLAVSSMLLAALSTSTYVFTVYVPTLLSLQAFSVFETWLPLVVVRTAEALGAFIGVAAIARRGFKRSIRVFVSLMVSSTVLLVVSASWATSTTHSNNSWESAAPLLLTMGSSVVAMLASGSWSCVLAQVSGYFPVSWRGRGVGFAFALASATDAIGSYLYPYLFNDLRLPPLAITMLFSALLIAATLAATAGPDRSLPSTESLPLLKTWSADSNGSDACDEDMDLRQKRDKLYSIVKRRGERVASVSLVSYQVAVDDRH